MIIQENTNSIGEFYLLKKGNLGTPWMDGIDGWRLIPWLQILALNGGIDTLTWNPSFNHSYVSCF